MVSAFVAVACGWIVYSAYYHPRFAFVGGLAAAAVRYSITTHLPDLDATLQQVDG